MPLPDRVVIVTGLLLDRPMCLDCIATKAGVTVDEAVDTLVRVTAVLELTSERARCRNCDADTAVFSLQPKPY